jgi:cytochrome c oxidase subunit 2
MSTNRNDMAFKVSGIVGLAVLLGLVLWARQPRQAETRQPDRPDPVSHGHDVGRKGLNKPEAGTLIKPSGQIEDGVRVIDYDAFQYGFDPDPLVVRAGERVRLRVKSRDVTHGAMIPEVDFSTDMPTDKRKTAEFVAPAKPGEYPVFCSVFCGPSHGDMKGRLLVLPAGEGMEHRND